MFTLKRTSLLLSAVLLLTGLTTSCENYMKLKSIGLINVDTLMVEVEPLVILTMYQNTILPEKFEEVYAAVSKENVFGANFYNMLVEDMDLLSLDQDTYDDIIYETVHNSYVIAWENIEYIVFNHITEEEFHMGDVDDEYAPEFIKYFFETITSVESRVVLGEPVIVKDEEEYATLMVMNTLTGENYFIRLSPMEGSEAEYYIEVSEL